MAVRPRTSPCASNIGDMLSLIYLFSNLYMQLAAMRVHCNEAAAVIYLNNIIYEPLYPENITVPPSEALILVPVAMARSMP